MKVKTEELEQCEVLMTIKIEPKQEQKMLQRAAKKIAREVKIPGFRPGKAPYNVVLRRFGPEAVQQEALEKSADKIIQEALDDAEVQPIAQIQLDSIEWDPLTIKLKVPTRPIVELGNYRDIRLDVEEIEVTETDIAETLKNFQEQIATWKPVERPAAIDDLISMALVQKDGDKVLAEHESIDHELAPYEEHEGHGHPDLTTPLLGLSAGDEKSFTLTYSEEFGNDQYAGKDITFEVEVLSVKEKEVEPLDDEFAKSISDFETLEALKNDVEEKIRIQRESQQTHELGSKSLTQVIEEAQVEWPAAFEEENVDREIKRYERQLETYGLTIDNYLKTQDKTEEEYRNETREGVIEQLKRSLVLNKLAELEKIDVSESEILAQAKLVADMSGRGDEFWRNIIASETKKNLFANDVLVDKTIRWLGAIAMGEDPQPEADIEEPSETDGDDDASDVSDTEGETEVHQIVDDPVSNEVSDETPPESEDEAVQDEAVEASATAEA